MIAKWLLRGGACALLLAWAAGLVYAAVQLRDWDRELVAAMLQIRADHTFRVRMAQRREPIPREWYRAKALALLAAGDRLQDDSQWARFVPGSWPQVDRLRDQVAQRIQREFSEIAVETIRRELDWRASQLTGAPRDPRTGELSGRGGCDDPGLPASFYRAGSAGQLLPELQAVQSHLSAIEELDRAVRALGSLEASGTAANPQALRELVQYTLGVELPGELSRSAVLLRQVIKPADLAQHAVRMAHLQQAVRCSLGRRMAALDARVFERNDLLASEAALAPRLAELYRPGAVRPVSETVTHWREIVTLIGEQERLLGGGPNGWLSGRARQLGPLHEAVLARVDRVGLLGPEAEAQLRRQSALALQHLQRQLRSALAGGSQPALVWREADERLVVAPERAALREQLAALLQQPFMAPAALRTVSDRPQGAIAWDGQRLATALELGSERRRFIAERLPLFPAGVRAAVMHVVDRRFAEQAQDAVAGAWSAAAATVPSGAGLTAWRAQRQQAAQVQSVLAQLGDRAGADRVRLLLAGDAAARLAFADDALARSQLASPRLQDFGWWRGDGAPILGAFAVADALTLRYVLAQQVSALDAVRAQARPLLDARAVPGDAVARWQAIATELDRYHAGRGDSSLLALERAVLALADLTPVNCADRLGAAPPPRPGDDVFAQAHRRMLEALARRCGELRQPAPPRPLPIPAPLPPLAGPAPVPFG